MQFTPTYRSPLGEIFLTSDGTGLTALRFEGQKYFETQTAPNAEEEPHLPVFVETGLWLDQYFNGEKPDPSSLVLAPQGSRFRQLVWEALLQIPYGQTATYGEIARIVAAQMGRTSMSSQAVGGAVGHNPLSVIIPCHRVVGANHTLTGYAGGLAKKYWLLDHEGTDLTGFVVPPPQVLLPAHAEE